MEISIDAKNMSKVYGKGRTAVKAVNDVTLHIEKGEVVLIMGPSGSGKTTMLLILGGLLKPDRGSVMLDDKDITKLSERQLPSVRVENFGFVFQKPRLLSSLTALENVEAALNLAGEKGEDARSYAKELLEGLGLRKRLNHLPDELSGGEQQRVAIARALANDPAIILADEPTANLDSKTGRKIVKLLREIAKEEERSIVIASHDPRIKEFTDRILWLEDGKLSVKQSPGMAADPVCKMLVDKKTTEYTSTFKKQKFYFCSERCKLEFEENPESYLKQR